VIASRSAERLVYAINPARDLGPRIMHCLLPIPNKRDGDWSYAPVPVIGSNYRRSPGRCRARRHQRGFETDLAVPLDQEHASRQMASGSVSATTSVAVLGSLS